MSLTYEIKIAFRYLRARKEEGFISVGAWFSLVGIMLGVATLIVVMSVMNGFRVELMDKILGVNGHITISGPKEGIYDYPKLAYELRKIEGVKAVTPLVDGQALASFNGLSTGSLVKGIAKEDLASKRIDDSTVVEGALDGYGEEEGVLVGSRLADKIRLKVGDDITITSPKGLQSVMGSIPRSKAYKVIGFFEVGMYDYDSATIVMPLSEAQKFFQFRETVSDIELRLDDPSKAKKVMEHLVGTLSPQFMVYDWQRANQHLVNALDVERNVMFLILTLIILIAAFNIISSMIMLVKDKTRDIAILRTMGASRNSIMGIFLITGSSIGVVGTLAGFVLGISFALNIEEIRQGLQSLLNVELFSAEIYYLTQLPAQVNNGQVISVVLMALCLSLLATVYPAWKAAKTDPAEALRYG